MRTGFQVAARLSAPGGGGGGGGPGPGTRGCGRAGRVPSPCRPPAPGPASPGHPAPQLATSGRATSSLLSCSPGLPPGLGAVTGGRGGTRRARRLPARAGERGAAGRSGRPGVWASAAPVSRSPRGAPGEDGAGGRHPHPKAAGRGRAGRRGPAAGRGRGGVRRACHSGRRWGSRAVSANFNKGQVLAPRGSPSPRAGVRGDGAGPPAAPGARRPPPGRAAGAGALESPALPSPTEASSGVLSQPVPFADFLKSYNSFFSLQPSIFLKQNLDFGQDGPALGP